MLVPAAAGQAICASFLDMRMADPRTMASGSIASNMPKVLRTSSGALMELMEHILLHGNDTPVDEAC